MGITAEEIEGAAEALYQEAGTDTGMQVSPTHLARALLGPRSVFSVHAASLPGDGFLASVEGQARIYLRSRLPRARFGFAVMHELAEWHLARVGYQAEDVEVVADALAAALLVPRRSFLSALRDLGDDLAGLADRFATTQSCVALRLGETTGEPLVVVTSSVRVRGSAWQWPEEVHLRRAWAKPVPGTRRVQISEWPRRFVLRLD